MISSGAGLVVGIIAYSAYHILNAMIDSYTLKIQSTNLGFINIIQYADNAIGGDHYFPNDAIPCCIYVGWEKSIGPGGAVHDRCFTTGELNRVEGEGCFV